MTPKVKGRRRPVRRPAVARVDRAEPVAALLDLATVAAAWQRAFDADDRALAAVGSLVWTRLDLRRLRWSLAHERQEVAALLRGLG